MQRVCPSLNRLNKIHKFIYGHGVKRHSQKNSKPKVKLNWKNMPALCQQQLYTVFQLVDDGGKGYISSEDLIRVSSIDSTEGGDGGIADVLQLLRLGDGYGRRRITENRWLIVH